MKKMKTLFERVFEGHKIISVNNKVTEGCDWVILGEGTATRKIDGTCCLIQAGKLYARFDMKPGRKLPDGAIPCQAEKDAVTGHFPHWVPVNDGNKAYKWHLKAFENQKDLEDGTYELVGQHFNGNPEHVETGDKFIRHGSVILEDVPRTFEGIKEYLKEHEIEGIVFHRENGDMCKIKRTDFGFVWNGKTVK